MRTSSAVFALVAVLAAGCASKGPSALDARLPPVQYYDATVQTTRVTPNPQGAAVLSSGTGCDVIYIAPGSAPDNAIYAMRPTSRVPDADRCTELLRAQPGVQSLTAARQL